MCLAFQHNARAHSPDPQAQESRAFAAAVQHNARARTRLLLLLFNTTRTTSGVRTPKHGVKHGGRYRYGRRGRARVRHTTRPCSLLGTSILQFANITNFTPPPARPGRVVLRVQSCSTQRVSFTYGNRKCARPSTGAASARERARPRGAEPSINRKSTTSPIRQYKPHPVQVERGDQLGERRSSRVAVRIGGY